MATHSSILAWRIPWTEEPDGLQSTGMQILSLIFEKVKNCFLQLLFYIPTTNILGF